MLRRFLFLLSLVLVFISCDAEDNGMAEFRIAKAKWEKLQFKDYTIQENLSCFCAGLLEWTAKVSDGRKDTLYFDESKLYNGQTYQMVFEEAKTIEEAFDFVENFNTKSVATFNVTYDEQFGFPKSIAIDYVRDAVDDEITYLYSNFTPAK